jgi:hypothetical protein
LVGLCEAEGLLGCAETKASLRLAKTVPASLTGAAAALRYVRHHRFCAADLAAPADLSRALRSGYVTREQPRSPVRTVSAKSIVRDVPVAPIRPVETSPGPRGGKGPAEPRGRKGPAYKESPQVPD